MGHRYKGWVMFIQTENRRRPSNYRDDYTVKFNNDEYWAYMQRWLSPFGASLDTYPFYVKTDRLVAFCEQLNSAIKEIKTLEAVDTSPVEKIGTYKRVEPTYDPNIPYIYSYTYIAEPSVDRKQLLAMVDKLLFVITTAFYQEEYVEVTGDYDNS